MQSPDLSLPGYFLFSETEIVVERIKIRVRTKYVRTRNIAEGRCDRLIEDDYKRKILKSDASRLSIVFLAFSFSTASRSHRVISR